MPCEYMPCEYKGGRCRLVWRSAAKGAHSDSRPNVTRPPPPPAMSWEEVTEVKKWCIFDPVTIRTALLSVCGSEHWLKHMHALYPCARMFIDVGMNRGYTAALFLGMWAPALNVTPQGWWSTHVQTGAWENKYKHAQCGNCEECREKLSPFVHSRWVPAECAGTTEHTIRIFSFEGSQPLIDDALSLITSHLPQLAKHWWPIHRAASAESGVRPFEQGNTEQQQLLAYDAVEMTDNHRALRQRFNLTSIDVNVTTLDDFAVENALLDELELLKIDAEVRQCPCL